MGHNGCAKTMREAPCIPQLLVSDAGGGRWKRNSNHLLDATLAHFKYRKLEGKIMRRSFFSFLRGNDLSPVLIIPGLGGASAEHWQARWVKAHSQCQSVQQNNWNLPEYSGWIEGLETAIQDCATPPYLVAHSLGCSVVAHWALKHSGTAIQGALMVAPADVNSEDHTPPETRIFAPMPMTQLPFNSTVVASTNDPYVDLQQAKLFATAWGSDFINVGACGHINADSHLDNWDEGWDILTEMTQARTALSQA